MTTVARLRGVNVGGKGKLAMADLTAALVAAGEVAPGTHIQSGNAVFEGTVARNDLLDQIEARAGFRPEIMLTDDRTFPDIVRQNPLPETMSDPKSLHVFFLREPSKIEIETFQDAMGESDRIVLNRHAMYLHTPEYLSGSKIAQKAENLLGVSVTARNWNTVTQLAAMIESRA